MFLQNLRAKIGARLNGDSEAGFTLIELLVVMLILGILAAIAIPSFFNQRDKAKDAKGKEGARTAQTAMETWATDHGGKYAVGTTPPTAAELQEIETTLNDVELQNPVSTETSYTVQVNVAETGNAFKIKRLASGETEYLCTEKGNAGCPSTGAGTEGEWGG